MMKTRKLLCMILVVAAISCFSSMPSFAFATPSEAIPSSATSSNAFPIDDYIEFDDFDLVLDHPMLMSGGFDDITNTVDYGYLHMSLAYDNMSGVRKYYNAPISSSGRFSVPVPSDCASVYGLVFNIDKRSLPTSGKYSYSFQFSSDTGIEWASVNLWTHKRTNNAAQQTSNTNRISFTQYSGDLSFQTTINVTGVDVISHEIRPKSNSTSNLPMGGYIKINFSAVSSDTNVAVSNPVNNQSGSDVNQNIADNTSAMADTLEEIVQTISNQLEALWNQMFNLMHVPQLANDDKNTGLITGAIEEQIDADRQNTEDIIAAEESNATTIINNNNENTEKLTNGYDNSALNAENDKLNNSLTEYDNAEKQVMDKVNHALDDINFNQSLNNYMQPILLCSTFMQRLYDNSGGFKDVINLTLIVSIASIVIGIYRFKGGD